MKKLLLIGLCALTISASAGELITASFMNARSLVISNTLLGITNTLFAGGRGTNQPGVEYTNLFGTKIVLNAANTSTTNDVSRYNLLNDVAVPVDWPRVYGQQTNTIAASPFCAYIAVRGVGGASANAAGTNYFQFLDARKVPFTDRAFQFSFTPNTTTEICVMTNLTVAQLMGVSYIRPVYFAAGNAGTASAQFTIKSFDLIFWQP